MSKTFGFFKDMVPRGNVTTSNYPQPTYNVSVSLSNVDYATRTDTITFNVSTNLTNGQTIYLTTSNASGLVFADGNTVASATLDAFGNATISRKIAVASPDANNYTANFQLRTGDFNGDIFFSRTANITTANTIATGGTILSNVAGYKVHQFESTQAGGTGTYNFQVTSGFVNNAEYLIVGAGGTAGGWYSNAAGLPGGSLSIWANSRGKWAGGGGGGQVLNGNTVLVENTIYPISVGNGGLYSIRNIGGGTTGSVIYSYPSDGNASTAFGLTANGGGAGSWVALNLLFTGALYRFKAHTTNTGGGARPVANCVISSLGFAGGNGANANTSAPYVNNIAFDANIVAEQNMFAGGGAGAGGNATSAATLTPGNGGPGLAKNINGTTINYSAGGAGGGGDFTNSPVFGTEGTGWGSRGSGGSARSIQFNGTGQPGIVYVKYPAFQKYLSL